MKIARDFCKIIFNSLALLVYQSFINDVISNFCIVFQYTIDPVIPFAVTVSHWYYQTTNTYFDSIIFLSNNENLAQSIALNNGYPGEAGGTTIFLNSAAHSV